MNRSMAWAAAIAAVTVGGSVIAACLMPFVALAAMAAATLPRREGAATVAVAWAANQAIGFVLLGYPADAGTLGWGVALLIAALVAYAVVAAAIARRSGLLPFVIGAMTGFAAFEATLYLYGLAAGETGAFTPAIVALLARNEALWLAGLLAIRGIIVNLMPGWAPARRVAG